MNITKACPKCGRPMVLRHNKVTGGAFLGCSRWPECTETSMVPEDLRMRALGAPILPGFDEETPQ